MKSEAGEEWEELNLFVGEAIKQRPAKLICGNFTLDMPDGLPPNSLAAVLVGCARSILEHFKEQAEWQEDGPEPTEGSEGSGGSGFGN
jgi:hypothetical protein